MRNSSINKMLFSLICLLATSASFAAPAGLLEVITVREMEQFGNLFPGPRKQITILSRLTAEVVSRGCTKAEDFELKVAKKDGYQEVSLVRVTPDTCKKVAEKVELQWETDSMDASHKSPIRIMNPIHVEGRFSR